MGDNDPGHDERDRNGTNDFTRGGVDTGSGSSDSEMFEELQGEVDELGADELVKDPVYLEFLDSFGTFERDDDSMSLDELLEEAEKTDETQSRTTDGGEEQRRDHKRRIEVTDGDEDQESSLQVDELITALEHERVSDSKRARLRNALGIRDNRQVEVQLNYLKSRFLDLEAYLQAMEDLFDTDTDLLAEIDELHTELARLRDNITEQNERIEQLEADVETLKDDGGRREAELATIERRLDETNEMIEHNLSAIERELNTARQWRENVASAFRTAQPE